MARPPTQIVLSAEEREQLESIIRRAKSQRRHVERSRMVLMAADGHSNKAIAAALKTREARVSKWRTRFERLRMAGLQDEARSGRPSPDEKEFRRLLLTKIDEAPPAGYARWNGSLLAEALGVSADRVWAELRLLGISLQRRRSWCVSTDPQFAQKATWLPFT